MINSRFENAMSELAEAQARVSMSQEHMDKAVAAMTETKTRIGERLDAFISVLERYISEGRNGKV
ncbi:MAG TPA: hypothetical protein VF791_14475 [Pyrinomonadaceae bacterium]